MRFPTCSEYGKRQNEENRETSSVKSSSHQVGIVFEDSWPVVAQIVLNIEAGDDPAEDDTGLTLVVRDVSGVLNELGHINLCHIKSSDARD